MTVSSSQFYIDLAMYRNQQSVMQEEGDTMKEEFPGSAVRIGEEI